MTPKLILASSSPFRRMLMQNAGLAFEAHAARIDERAVEAPLERTGVRPDAVALVLARAKAEEVSSRFPDSLVIGSDQTMSLGDRVFHKPKDMADAASHLQALSGVTHRLNSAVAIVSDGVVLWEHLAHAELTMRPLTAEFIARHLARVGGKAPFQCRRLSIGGAGHPALRKDRG
ncbi:septum formation protein [Rhizobium leguminosarum]